MMDFLRGLAPARTGDPARATAVLPSRFSPDGALPAAADAPESLDAHEEIEARPARPASGPAGQAARPEPHAPAWIPNVVLHILFDTGIIGLLVATAAVAVGVGSAVRALAKSPRRWGSVEYILLGALVACGALALSYQMTDGTWLGFTWFLFALLVVSARQTIGSRQVT